MRFIPDSLRAGLTVSDRLEGDDMSYVHTEFRFRHAAQERLADRVAVTADKIGRWLVRKLNWSPHVDGVIVLALVGGATAALNILALQV